MMSDTDFYVPDQVSLKLVPADAALTHESAKTEGCLKGWIPSAWCCIDCGFNTAPCLSTRAETKRPLQLARRMSNKPTTTRPRSMLFGRGYGKGGVENTADVCASGVLRSAFTAGRSRKTFSAMRCSTLLCYRPPCDC